MADYTSTQNGNWSADATWGGGGHPSANDDTATIGHEVNYDMGDSAITWGNVTINNAGVLIFPIASDSTILFNATAILTINSGGELRAGTSGAPIAAANHCYIHWTTGASSRNVLRCNNGGTINIYGDPSFYGSTRTATLDSDWTAGQTLYVQGDYSSLWQSGQQFWIIKNALYSDYQTDSDIFTIDTVGTYDSGNDRTPLTISEAAPGVTYDASNSGANNTLIMVSRNVHIGDSAATIGVYTYNDFTRRIQFYTTQGSSLYSINFKDALFIGWRYGVNGGYNVIFNQCIFNSCAYVVHQSTMARFINTDIISNNYFINDSILCDVSGGIVAANYYGIYGGKNSRFELDFIGNYRPFYLGFDFAVNGNFYNNSSCFLYTADVRVIGDFRLNTNALDWADRIHVQGDFSGNTKDSYYSNNILIKGNLSAINHQFATTRMFGMTYENCDIGGTVRKYRAYTHSGNVLPLTSADGDWQTPPSNESWILQMTPNSACSAYEIYWLILSPLRDMALYCDAGTYTLTIKIYPFNWTTALDQDDVYIKAHYLSSTDGTRATVKTTSETYANDGWRECTVTFTTGQAGIVYFNLYCTAYESARYILVDPHWKISSVDTTLDMQVLHGSPFKFSGTLPVTGTSLEAKIYATLTAAAGVTSKTGTRIYPQVRPQNESKPSLVYTRIGGMRDITINEGYTNLENPRIEIQCFATAVDARRELGEAVITAMEASTRFTAVSAISPVDFYDPTTQEYKRILDFSIWNHDT